MQVNTLTGTITHVTAEKTTYRADINKNFRKMVITFTLEDGQVLFPEILNHRIDSFNKSYYMIGEKVEIGFFFRGQIKGDKRYNNIHLETIKRITS